MACSYCVSARVALASSTSLSEPGFCPASSLLPGELHSSAHVGREGNFIVHPVINIDGDEATGTWMSYFMHVKDHGDPLHWMQGIYDCKYVRENGRWKISVLKWRARLKYRESEIKFVP